MKKIIFLSIAVFYIQIFSYAQDTEQKAKDILSEISSQTSSYENMTFDFTLGIKSQDINEVQNGKAIISENNFYYETTDREVISNGTSVWTYMKEDNECYIDDINDISEDLNPSEIMTIWEDNFKVNYIDEVTSNEQTLQRIKLYPIDVKNSKYHTVILKVNQAEKQVHSAIIKTKDGVTLSFKIKDLLANQKIKENQFKWNPSLFPAVEEIDNR